MQLAIRSERADDRAKPGFVDDDVVVDERQQIGGAAAHGAIAGDIEAADRLARDARYRSAATTNDRSIR